MSYTKVTPTELLSHSLDSADLNNRPWTVAWDEHQPVDLEWFTRHLPPQVDFFTSGSTGTPRVWRRTVRQLWEEAGLLADFLRAETPEAVMSFAPPRHVFGALVSVLVPARLGLPVWYRPQYSRMPDRGTHDRWAVMAIPWAFEILRQRPEWLTEIDHLAVLHSTASLPASAPRLLEELGKGNIREIFGSTETGGVATRLWGPNEHVWHLLEDVTLAGQDTVPGNEAPLCVSSPRLAFEPGGSVPDRCCMDDHVTLVDDRSFHFSGRRERIVNVNGRRWDLDDLESRLRELTTCQDLACVPVRDEALGEHVEVLVVPPEESDRMDLREAFGALEIKPRRVHVVEKIERSETGKLRRLGGTELDGTGAKA